MPRSKSEREGIRDGRGQRRGGDGKRQIMRGRNGKSEGGDGRGRRQIEKMVVRPHGGEEHSAETGGEGTVGPYHTDGEESEE